MAESIEKVIKIESAGSEQTVRGLKKEIEALRDALLNTEKGSDEYKKVLELLITDQKKLAEAMNAGKNEVSAATGSYNALKVEMSALKKVWQEVTDEASRSDIGKRINEINNELKGMDASIGNFQRNVGNYKSARQELGALKSEMDKLNKGTDEYNAAFQRAAEITHNLQERQQMLRYSAADLGQQLENAVSIGSSLVAGFNSINAVMALTGDKSEDLQKVMMKLQAGIALVQGLKGLEGMTKRMRGFLDGVTAMIFKTREATTAVAAETTAVGANTAAQEANTVATAGATVATKAFQKALVATGIGAIIVLLGTLIAHWEDLKDMVGLSNEKLGQFKGVMDQVKVVIGGVGNAIFKLFIIPIKTAITAISALGNATQAVFSGNFKDAAKIAKEGIANIAKTYKEGFSVITNFQKGAAETSKKIQEKRTREALEATADELNETIKDNEAKYGSDWKYTQEGKKLYQQMYDAKLKSLKKDSKEYREANREKMAYDREFTEHNKKTRKETTKAANEATDQMLKEAERIEKRAKDSQKTELQLTTEKYEEEKALLEKYGMDTEDLTKEYEAKVTEIKEEEEKKRRDEIEKTKREEEKALEERTANALKAASKSLDKSDDKNETEVRRIELEYSLKEAQGTGVLSFNDLIEETNRIYEANKQHLEEQAAEYKKLMDDNTIDTEAREDAEREYNKIMEELRAEDTQNLIDNLNLQKEAIEQQIEMYSNLAQSIGDIFGSIADIMEEDIKNKIKNGKITEEEGKKQFESVKAFQIAQATINTISGAIAAFMSCQSTYPQPYGAIIGAVQAAVVTAAGVAQIAKIKSTQLGSSSNVSTTMAASSTQPQPEEYTPQYTQNYTGESEITKLADSIKNQRVIVVESDITEAQRRSKVRVTESTW